MRTLNTSFRHTITNNFNDEIIYTTTRGKDLKIEVRSEARKHGKTEKDFIITKI